MSMYGYSCYGLQVRSELEIPEFILSPANERMATADVEIRLGAVDWPRPPLHSGGTHVSITPEGTHFYWEHAGDYLVREGRSIVVRPAPGAEAGLLRLPLLGVVFGALLAQRGLQILHASAVEMGGEVVGLIGDKGMGKSTTAAALHQAGHRAVADDVLALRPDGDDGGYAMLPAFPHLKLWPQTVTYLGQDPYQLRPLHSRVSKRAFSLSGAFPTAPLPMARLYILGWGERTAVEPISPMEAFTSLVPHTLACRYGPNAPETMSQLLQPCSALVKGIPTKRLVRKVALSELDRIAEVVEHDLSGAS